MDAPNHYIDLDATRADMTTISENMEFIQHAMLQKGTNEFLPASSKNLTKLLQKIDRFTVRLYIYIYMYSAFVDFRSGNAYLLTPPE